MASLVDVVDLCRLRMRPIQIHLLKFYRPESGDMRVRVPLELEVTEHLKWWLQVSNWMAGDRLPAAESSNINDDGCVASRLGGALARSDGGGPMVRSRKELSHQSAGAESSRERSKSVPKAAERLTGHSVLRQHNNSRLHQQARGDSIPISVRSSVEADSGSARQGYQAQSSSRSGGGQRPGGRTVKGSYEPQRMGVVAVHVRNPVSTVGPSTYRPLREAREREVSDVLHKNLRTDSVGHGRILVPVGRSGSICIPTSLPDQQSTDKSQRVSHADDTDSPILAQETMVSRPPTAGGSTSASAGCSKQGEMGRVPTSHGHQRPAGFLRGDYREIP